MLNLVILVGYERQWVCAEGNTVDFIGGNKKL